MRRGVAGEPFFEVVGDEVRPQVWTRGPWNPEHQHGGPPAALLCRALEREVDDPRFFAARLHVDLPQPVPLTPLRLVLSLERRGRSVIRAAAELQHEGRPVCQARAVFIRSEPGATPAAAAAPLLVPLPDAAAPFEFGFFLTEDGYHRAMEMRLARGRWGEVPVSAWMRMTRPLVAGEDPSPLQRVLCAVDSANGIGAVANPAHWTFVNPDLDVSLHRPLQGEWLGMEIDARAADGVGATCARLFDPQGPIGTATQTLVVRRRS